MRSRKKMRLWLFLFVILLLAAAISQVFTRHAASKKSQTIHIVLQRSAENSQDFKLVENELNRYLAQNEDFQVQFKIVDEKTRETDYMRLLKSAEPIDLIFGDMTSLKKAANAGLLEPLDSLLQTYGSGIKAVLNKEYLDTGYVDKIRYGLPTVRDYSSSSCFEYNIDLAEKCGLEMDTVTDLDSLETQLFRLKEADPFIIPVANNHYYGLDALLKIDPVGDDFRYPLAVLQDYGRSPKVVTLSETPEFADFINRMYRWHQNGLLMPDSGTTISAINYIKSGKVLGCFSHYHPGFDIEETRGSGIKIGCVLLSENYINSFSANRLFWEIPSKSESKEIAMRFLELMYTDENVVRILSYGCEGVHYEYKNSDKTVIGYPSGINVDNSRYSQFFGWMYGNEMLMPVWDGLPDNLWAQITDYNDHSIQSAAINFCFDPTPVEKEINSCEIIMQKYYFGLITGELNPEKYLPILQQGLKEAGIDSITAEKQKQLNQYLEGGTGA